MKGDALSLVRLYDSMIGMEKIAADVRERFEREMNRRMPKIWELHARGRMWEYDEKYHPGCDCCMNAAIEALRLAVAKDPEADA